MSATHSSNSDLTAFAEMVTSIATPSVTFVAAVALAAGLSACSGSTESPAASSEATTETPSAPASGSPETTPTPTETGDFYQVLGYTCGGAHYDDMLAARKSGEHCDAESNNGGDIEQREMDALNKAYGEGRNHPVTSLDILYGLCATNIDPAETYPYGMTAPQIAEVEGMLSLCGQHPQADAFHKYIEESKAQEKERAAGTRFHDGVYVVGEDIPAGTYAVEDVEGCYWERQDANGNTIDNDFKTAAARVQVTVAATDYAFVAEGCGEWSKVN